MARNLVKAATQTSFTKSLFTDTGNIPLVIANSCGALLVISHCSRKMFYHPDVSVSDELRNSHAVQNETLTRLTDADLFRNQTASFARWIEPKGLATAGWLTGQTPSTMYAKWDLSFTKMDSADLLPLERTNFFDDGLYEDAEPKLLSLNEEVQQTHKTQTIYELNKYAN